MGKATTGPTTTKQRAFGRSLSDFPNLNDAEKRVLACTSKGEIAFFGNEIPRTEAERKERTVRAGLMRFLALGGDDATSVHEKGIQIRGALVDGPLDFESCTLVGDIFLWNCELSARVTLRGARTRSLIFDGTHCRNFSADEVEVAGVLYFRNGSVARGEMRLPGAKITGDFDCDGARLEGRDTNRNALVADRIEVRGNVFLRNGFVAKGAVRLGGAKITGNLECDRARLEGWDIEGLSLRCDGIQVGGSVFLRDGLVLLGAVRLVGANITTNLDCGGGLFRGRDEDGDALACDGIQVGGVVNLNDGFVAAGAVRFIGSIVRGDISCFGGSFGSGTDTSVGNGNAPVQSAFYDNLPIARPLTLAHATIEHTLWLSGNNAKFHGGVDLTGARIGRIVDKIDEHTRPRTPDSGPSGAGDDPALLHLDGLTYDRFGGSTDLGSSARIAFLQLQRPIDLCRNFKPQPWMQMVKVLRDTGHADAARHVAIAYEEARRGAGNIPNKAARTLHWLYGILVGYGHRPMQLLRITFSLWLICAAIYFTAAELGVMAPTNPRVFDEPKHESCRPENGGNWTTCVKAPYEYTTFNPWVYSLDLMLPFVDLQQDRDWAPMMTRPCAVTKSIWVTDICWRSAAVAKAAGEPVTSIKPAYWISGTIVAAVMWFEILFGWAASLLLAAVLSGLAKRME